MLMRCFKCGKLKQQYRLGWCQTCYRANSAKYKFYTWKDEDVRPRWRSKSEYICQEMIKEKMSAREFMEKKGKEKNICSESYVRKVVEKYLKRCDSLGRGENE